MQQLTESIERMIAGHWSSCCVTQVLVVIMLLYRSNNQSGRKIHWDSVVRRALIVGCVYIPSRVAQTGDLRP
jgi:hypothetical protein